MNLFSPPTRNANYPMCTLPAVEAQPLSDASDEPCQKLTDSARECAIALAGSMVLHHMAEWEAHGCFDDRAKAALALRRVEALVKARSSEQVARMERERGLS